jgi:tRNA threonylcarbamoyladenosine biosynthesis protein TsaE
MLTITTHNEQETEALGYQLASFLRYEEAPVILLEGDLAAGKTTLTKGIGKALGITRVINSPSYTIMKVYQSKTSNQYLYHFDLYRLEENNQDYDLEEYMYSEGFKVIEWPNKVPNVIPEHYLKVSITSISDHKRQIKITCHAPYCIHLEHQL